MGTTACNYHKDPESEIETDIFGPDGQILVHKKQVSINNLDY